MLKTLILTTILTHISFAQAQSNAVDFSETETKQSHVTEKDIRSRLEVTGEVYVTDSDGNLMFQESEIRTWAFGSTGNLTSNWTFASPNIESFAIRHIWEVSKDGKLNVTVQQYDSIKRSKSSKEIKFGKLLKEEKMNLKNFAPIVWTTSQNKSQNVIIRLTPRLTAQDSYTQINKLPISLKDAVIYDESGHLWAAAGSVEGPYLGITTHQGRILLSYYPFKGAKELGYAKDSQIVIKTENNLKLRLQSTSPITTTSDAIKVYVIVDQKKRSPRVSSVHVSSASSEKGLFEHLN